MTTGMRKGLIVAAIHLALVGSLGAKLLIDRATRPRVWARTLPVDPDHPLRGRYVQMRVEGEPVGFADHRRRLLGDALGSVSRFALNVPSNVLSAV